MIDLNFRHLLYFYVVARERSVTAAAKTLHVTQPTISGQLKLLEEQLGEALFRRKGRGLELTDAGETAYEYAERIFGLGRDLVEAVKHHRDGRRDRLVVGISDVVPKLIALRVLEPVLHLDPPVQLDCRQDRPERLLTALGLGDLDVVLADAPVRAGTPVRVFNHLLGESGMTFFAAPALASSIRGEFPASLDGAPMLLPSSGTILRASLDRWLEHQGVLPFIVGEFHDSAQMNAFGQAAAGVFAAPTVIEREVEFDYHVEVVGRVSDVRERLYAISTERRLRHPAVAAMTDLARNRVFHQSAGESVAE